MLAARLAAKRARRYAEADDLLEQLGKLGVRVDDSLQLWRADGQEFAPTSWSRIEGDGDEGDEGDEGGVDEEAVEALISQRGEAKQAKDYETADELAATLREAHSVVLDDKRRRWRVVVEYGGYYRVGPKVDPFTTKQVGDMLERRSAHQAKKEYEEADRLHAELTEMGIVLDTRLKTWKRPAPKATRR
uniref:Uncharacterized protein n=1 Tax=Prymnesium polylepis TaxID=72548 RepID=A0A7S4IZ89_9EUKA